MAYCTLADVKAYLGITETTDDALIENAIVTAKQAIDHYTHKVFDVTVDTTKYFSSNTDSISGRSLLLGRHLLATAPTKVSVGGLDVTSAIKVYGDAPYWSLILSGASGFSWRDSGDVDPEEAIEILGKWGYSTVAPSDVQGAAVIWASHLYQIKDASPDGTLTMNSQEHQQRIVKIPANVQVLLIPYKGVL